GRIVGPGAIKGVVNRPKAGVEAGLRSNAVGLLPVCRRDGSACEVLQQVALVDVYISRERIAKRAAAAILQITRVLPHISNTGHHAVGELSLYSHGPGVGVRRLQFAVHAAHHNLLPRYAALGVKRRTLESRIRESKRIRVGSSVPED